MFNPAIAGAVTTHQVRKLRPAVKFLTGDYLTYQVRNRQSGGGPHCRLCPGREEEDICHIISSCPATSDIRERIVEEILIKCKSAKTVCDTDTIKSDPVLLTQFILDCTSLNLNNGHRIHVEDPIVPDIFRTSRDLCHALHSERLKQLKRIESESKRTKQ